MTGIEIITGVAIVAVATAATWGLVQLAKFLGISKNSKAMDMIEEYVDKAVEKYDDKLTEYIESKGQDISIENELVKNILSWLNANAPKLIKDFFGKNQEQIEEFVRNYIKSLLNKELEQILS